MADTHETIADIIAEMRGMGNYQRYSGDHARVLAGRIEAAHKREIEDAERRGNHAAMGAVAETIQKVGPLYDAESIGNVAALREALEFAEDELWAHGLFDASKRIASALAATETKGAES